MESSNEKASDKIKEIDDFIRDFERRQNKY